MDLRVNIQPRYVLATVALLTVLMVGTALVELRQSREEFAHLLREEALSLAETIDRGGTNAVISMDRLETLLAERLLNNAYYIARLDSLGSLRRSDLATFAEENRLFRINIFDRQGRRLMSSHSPSPDHALLPEKESPASVLAPVLAGLTEELVIGIKEARFEEGQRFAVAVRRTHRAGGAVVVNVDAADLLQFRLSIGIGKLIRDLGDNSGIVYAALQDGEGIIAASGAVRELSSFGTDSTLELAFAGDTTLARVVAFEGSEVFEVVRPFAPNGEAAGVLRIAIAMDELRSAEQRMNRRMVIMSLVVIILGALAIVFLMAQQNVRTVEKKYRSIKTFTGNILAQMRDGVVTVDAPGTVTIFNDAAAEILALERTDVEGRPLQALAGAAASQLVDIFARADGTSEATIEIPGGGRRTVAVTLSTTRDSGGEQESRTAVLRDQTESRRLEREAQRREKLAAMGELASGVAHEIRNPLNAIGMIAQRFAREFTPRAGVKEYRTLAAVMQDEARRVNAIIRQFPSFARPAKLRRRPIEVSELTEHVGSLFAAQAAEGGVSFSGTCPGGLTADLDREQMTQALLNLLQNALEATPRGGRITLACESHGRGVRFTVADTGRGIPPGDLDKIFNLYYTTRQEGTGLGLSITQQIVAQHGGWIDVESVERRGSTFVVTIPETAERSSSPTS